jgi:hypothetical protein
VNGTDSLEALRRANPRHDPHFRASVTRLTAPAGRPAAPPPARTRRWPLVLGVPAVALTAILVIALVVAGSPATDEPAAAMERAAAASASAADQSGIVTVEITQDGAPWGTREVHWHGRDLWITDLPVITDLPPGRPASAGGLLVVDGMMYSPDPETPGGWSEMGPPSSIDPGSGTTPDQYLEAVEADAGGDTLRRVTEAMTDLTTSSGDGGSTVYQGHVPAQVLAPETGTKDGAPIRVLPYGYVAHDDASDPSAPITVTITVGADDTIESLVASWGGASSWTYRLTFSQLGSAPALTAPENPRPLR